MFQGRRYILVENKLFWQPFSSIYMNLQMSVCQKSYFLCYQLVKSKLQLADSKWNMKVQQTSTKDANS